MSNDDRFDLVDWLTFKRRLDFSKARWLGPLVVVIATLLVVLAIAAAFALLLSALFGGLLKVPGSSLGVGGVTVALIGAPFVIWRSIVAQKQADIAEQGLITDRINKAVEGLGAEKTVIRDGEEWTEPNLEVRIGAIYALERISQDSSRDHIQVMEILCAYIRQNAPVSSAFEIDTDEILENAMKALQDPNKKKNGLRPRLGGVRSPIDLPTKKIPFPRQDIQTAISAIGRNRTGCNEQAENSEGRSSHLDLRRCNLQRVEFGEGDYSNISFFGCALDAANFSECNLSHADIQQSSSNATWFHGANCEGLQMSDSKIMGAIFTGANLFEAHLSGTLAVGAYFINAHAKNVDLYGADIRFALCWNTNFVGSHFINTDLKAANLKSSNCGRVRFQKCQHSEETVISKTHFNQASFHKQDFSRLPLAQDQINKSFGDASVTLPGGHGPEHESWPAHWPKFELEYDQFKTEWRKWQADPDNYTPPDPPDPDA